ncbi:MAG: multidrug efflux MFS transporter [Clostridium perfringens]|nr:multidrug efflux MFS transporter [Clostridium perfringens]
MEIWKRNLFVCWFGAFITAIGLSQIAPFLPVYIKDLGVTNTHDIDMLSGICFGITFLMSAIVSPMWAKLSDKHGRKPMLLRASFGMALIIFLMGFSQNVYELTILRILQGAVSGYTTACITLVATQTSKKHVGWALGVLSTATVSGSLIGPLVGGYLADTIGIRNVFFVIGILLFITFIATMIFVKEDFEFIETSKLKFKEVWKMVPQPQIIISLFITGFILRIALYSIEPMMTQYIATLTTNTSNIILISGIAFSATGLGSILAAPTLGKLSDRIGTKKIILVSLIFSAIIYLPQAFVNNPFELTLLRVILGFATAGIVPGINSMIKRATKKEVTARVLGVNMSFQYLGTFIGAIVGGQVGAYFGIRDIFFITSGLLIINALIIYFKIYRKSIVL